MSVFINKISMGLFFQNKCYVIKSRRFRYLYRVRLRAYASSPRGPSKMVPAPLFLTICPEDRLCAYGQLKYDLKDCVPGERKKNRATVTGRITRQRDDRRATRYYADSPRPGRGRREPRGIRPTTRTVSADDKATIWTARHKSSTATVMIGGRSEALRSLLK